MVLCDPAAAVGAPARALRQEPTAGGWAAGWIGVCVIVVAMSVAVAVVITVCCIGELRCFYVHVCVYVDKCVWHVHACVYGHVRM